MTGLPVCRMGGRVLALLAAAVLALVLAATAQAEPVIESLSPDHCAPGDVVDILGTGFGDVPGRVTVAGVHCGPNTSRLLAWTDNRITVRVPDFRFWPCLTERDHGVRVKAYVDGVLRPSNQARLLVSKTEATGCPAIYAVEPESAPMGTAVSITGCNFGEEAGVIRVGKRLKPGDPNILSWTDTRIDFIVPGYDLVCKWGPRRYGLAVLTGPEGSRASSNYLSLTIGPPYGGCPDILAIAPNLASSGETIFLFGQGFGEEPGSIALTEWLDRDSRQAGAEPVTEVYGPPSPNILKWTNTQIRFVLGPLEGWREWAGRKAAHVSLLAGPPGVVLKSNQVLLTIKE